MRRGTKACERFREDAVRHFGHSVWQDQVTCRKRQEEKSQIGTKGRLPLAQTAGNRGRAATSPPYRLTHIVGAQLYVLHDHDLHDARLASSPPLYPSFFSYVSLTQHPALFSLCRLQNHPRPSRIPTRPHRSQTSSRMRSWTPCRKRIRRRAYPRPM